MTPPYWIKKLDELERETANWNPAKTPISVHTEQCEAFAQECESKVRPLLTAYLKMREAVENAPHGMVCASAICLSLGKDPCNCWKSQALAYDPTKEAI